MDTREMCVTQSSGIRDRTEGKRPRSFVGPLHFHLFICYVTLGSCLLAVCYGEDSSVENGEFLHNVKVVIIKSVPSQCFKGICNQIE